ncbi:uncharacterized protein PSFLO_04300 [Pseudozyma flocculosa]|uniref:Uncharacterized protein n=1 Tax=Pseudozyma flocculosa TaxID=84751 RepID=A0A5C3F6E3_9BASI|nr:uncharacterized protein PSFLO_04300 [Pseudozyma flocculosa]
MPGHGGRERPTAGCHDEHGQRKQGHLPTRVETGQSESNHGHGGRRGRRKAGAWMQPRCWLDLEARTLAQTWAPVVASMHLPAAAWPTLSPRKARLGCLPACLPATITNSIIAAVAILFAATHTDTEPLTAVSLAPTPPRHRSFTQFSTHTAAPQPLPGHKASPRSIDLTAPGKKKRGTQLANRSAASSTRRLSASTLVAHSCAAFPGRHTSTRRPRSLTRSHVVAAFAPALATRTVASSSAGRLDVAPLASIGAPS